MEENSPIVLIIEKMFSNELSGTKWKALKVTDVVFLFEKYSKEVLDAHKASGKRWGPPLSVLHGKMQRKLASFKTVTDQLMYLNERMIG